MNQEDIERVLEQNRRDFDAHLEAVAKCSTGKGHVGKQLSMNVVDCLDWEKQYRCSTCGWMYSVKMKPAEIRDYKREMEKTRCNSFEPAFA